MYNAYLEKMLPYIEKEFEIYAAMVEWRPLASISMDWSLCVRTDAEDNLQVTVGDA